MDVVLPRACQTSQLGCNTSLAVHTFSSETFFRKSCCQQQLGAEPWLSCLAAEQAAVQNCHGGTAPLLQEARAGVGNSTPFPLSCQSITASSSRRCSPRCLHQLSVEVFLWEGGLEAFTLWLAFLRSASVSLAGLWLQPSKLTLLSGRKIREENVFEIPSLLNQRYTIVVSNCKTIHCLHYISYSYFFQFFHTCHIKYICLQKDEPNLSHFLSGKLGIVQLY